MYRESYPLWLLILPILLSGLVGVLISNWDYRRFERRKLRLDTFRRLLAYRHAAVPGSSVTTQEHFFSALNEVFVVFYDSKPIVRALLTMHAELGLPGRLLDNIVTLIKAICKDLKIPPDAVNDSFFLQPFVPGSLLVGKKET